MLPRQGYASIWLASSLPDHIRLTVFSALNGCVVENKNNQEVNE
jgi:hypothetical protein